MNIKTEDIVSPFLLIRSIPQLAKNEIPKDLKIFFGSDSIKPFILMEDATFFAFRYGLLLNTKKLGFERLFASEPEGIVLLENIPNPCAIMYECKCRANGYKMSRKDMLTYIDYIKRKKILIKSRYHLDLTHFVIISSNFKGKYMEKIIEIEKTGINCCLMPADVFSFFIEQIKNWEFEDLHILDLTNIFLSGLITDDIIVNECNKIKCIF